MRPLTLPPTDGRLVCTTCAGTGKVELTPHPLPGLPPVGRCCEACRGTGRAAPGAAA